MDLTAAHQALVLMARCGAFPAAPVGGLLLLTGLVGGVAHCGPMCGPFVIAQTAGAPALQRLPEALLLPYHCGRLVTYAGLGAVSGGLGAAAVTAGALHVVAAALLALAAAIFLTQGLARLLPRLPAARRGFLVGRAAAALARLCRPLLRRDSAPSRFALGLILGLLPCGFLYAAVFAAATSGSAAAGAAGLALFGLGTTPSLLFVGLGGAAAAARWRGIARRLAGPCFLFNGTVLAAMAARAVLAGA